MGACAPILPYQHNTTTVATMFALWKRCKTSPRPASVLRVGRSPAHAHLSWWAMVVKGGGSERAGEARVVRAYNPWG